MTHVALTIGGSDPSGGAGIQADLKTFHQRGVYGTSVLTLVTVQNTQRVSAVEILSPKLVSDQLEAVLEDIPPAAAKTGALGDRGIVELVAERARSFKFPLVIDPVMISKHGQPLLSDPARSAFARLLLPSAFVVTPNLPEAGELARMPVYDLETMKEAAVRIAALGANAVLLKGGHLVSRPRSSLHISPALADAGGIGSPLNIPDISSSACLASAADCSPIYAMNFGDGTLESDAVDVLYFEGKFFFFRSPRISTSHTHGTGCTLSACITAELAKGLELPEAVETAKKFITKAIETNPGLGKGAGPVNHHALI